MEDSALDDDAPVGGGLSKRAAQHALWDKYIEEMCVPSPPMSIKDWAELNGVTARSVQRWRDNPRFVGRLDEAVGSTITPEKRLGLSEVIYKSALAGDMQAARMWMEWADRLMPPPEPTRGAPQEFAEKSLDELLTIVSSLGGDVGGDDLD